MDLNRFLNNLVQYFEHDLLGPIPFQDKGASGGRKRCHPRHIKLGIRADDLESQAIRAEARADSLRTH